MIVRQECAEFRNNAHIDRATVRLAADQSDTLSTARELSSRRSVTRDRCGAVLFVVASNARS
jgi:hypothetical protein